MYVDAPPPLLQFTHPFMTHPFLTSPEFSLLLALHLSHILKQYCVSLHCFPQPDTPVSLAFAGNQCSSSYLPFLSSNYPALSNALTAPFAHLSSLWTCIHASTFYHSTYYWHSILRQSLRSCLSHQNASSVSPLLLYFQYLTQGGKEHRWIQRGENRSLEIYNLIPNWGGNKKFTHFSHI